MSYQIITFYEFKKLDNLSEMREKLKSSMIDLSILGTILIAEEGYNATVCGLSDNIKKFIIELEKIFETKLNYKTSFYEVAPFSKIKVKIKKEIVVLRQGQVDISQGAGTHVKYDEWNKIIADENTIILDTRNQYEYEVGTFKNALNPATMAFSELPKFVNENLADAKDKNIAMFCTGGIRCEKFAPFMKSLGYKNIYQLEGGILRYIEETPKEESLWEGECFVFDDRRTVDENLEKGELVDLSADYRKLNIENKK
jgi:UPF0176 protein